MSLGSRHLIDVFGLVFRRLVAIELPQQSIEAIAHQIALCATTWRGKEVRFDFARGGERGGVEEDAHLHSGLKSHQRPAAQHGADLGAKASFLWLKLELDLAVLVNGDELSEHYHPAVEQRAVAGVGFQSCD